MTDMDEEIASWLRDTIEGHLWSARGMAAALPGDGGWVVKRGGEDLDYTVYEREPDGHHHPVVIADAWREDAAMWIGENTPAKMIDRCEADLRMLDTFGSLALMSESYADMLLRELAWGWRYADGYKQEWAPDA